MLIYVANDKFKTTELEKVSGGLFSVMPAWLKIINFVFI